jgi:DUF1009 family protein
MPAAEKSLNPASAIGKLGIIAGGGLLPAFLLHACDQKGIEPFIIAFEGYTDPSLVRGREHLWTRFGAAGQIISTLRAHEIADITLAGSIERPSLVDLRPDLKGAEFLAKIGIGALGDNDFLALLRSLIESEGFVLHGVHKFAHDLLAPAGAIGRYEPKKADWIDIERGLDVSLEMGRLDIGQAVIVQEGFVLGVEAAEGTDELIQRCKHLKRKGRKGVLVKTCKPQQDRDFDLPTIGPETVKKAVDCDLAGIVIQAGQSLILEREKVVEIANHHKIFVVGVDPSFTKFKQP